MRKALFATVVLSGVLPFAGLGCSSNKAPTFANNTSSDWFGAKKLAALFKPEQEMNVVEQVHESDPTSLAHKSKPPGADLYVATAKLYERRENFAAAEEQYERALKISPNDLGALVGYAHLLDRQGQLEHATNYYRQAVKHHPQDAAAHNDLGLCYARRGMLNESLAELSKAIELDPNKPLYRNNIATVFLEMGQPQKALSHLAVGNQPAVAHYNLACLLHQRGQTQAAAYHFAQAAQHDPSLTAAQEWAQKLAGAAPPGSRMTNVRPVEQTSAYRPNTQWTQPTAHNTPAQAISFPPSGPQFREARVDTQGFGAGQSGTPAHGQSTPTAGGPTWPQNSADRNWSAFEATSSSAPRAAASGGSLSGASTIAADRSWNASPSTSRGSAYGDLPPTPETAGDYGATTGNVSVDTLPSVEQVGPRY
jgi:Flp pilus assembly protein TadD